jgi:taurine dioxygenase
VHPLVLRHPKTGIPALYLNVGLTGGILGYSPEHSRALMDAVDRHYSRPGASYRHHWLPGDVVVADNLHVAHKATPITPATRRILNRTTVRADGVIWAERESHETADI